MLGSSKSAIGGEGSSSVSKKESQTREKEKRKEEKKKSKQQKELETALEKQKRELDKERKELEKREKELEKKNSKSKKKKDKEKEPAETKEKEKDSVSSSPSSSSNVTPYIQSEKRRSGSWIRPRSLMLMKKVSRRGDSSDAASVSPDSELMPPPSSPHVRKTSNSLESDTRSSSSSQEGHRSQQVVSPRTRPSMLEQLKRLKANERDLIEFKTPPTMNQELQASTAELIKIIADCLVFNTHLKKLDLSGCELKETEAKMLADALRVNSTLEYLNMTWCNLGDAGATALASGLSINEGLKTVDLRHNRVTAKGLHAITSFLRINVTLLEFHLSEAEVLIDGDELIFEGESDSIIDQEGRDKALIEHILTSNRALSKCFSGESKKVDLSARGMERVPSLVLVIPTIVHLDLSHNNLKSIPRGIRQLTRLEHLNLSHNQLEELPRELGTLHTLKHLDVQHNRLSQIPLTLNLLDNLEDLDISNNNIPYLPISLGTLPSLKELRAHNNPLPYPKKVMMSSGGVLAHLREKNSGTLLCHRIKLMCVGQANVGKTSLVEKLLSKSVTKPTEPDSGARAGLRGNGEEEEVKDNQSGGKLNDSQRNRRWSYSEVEHGKLSLISSGGADGWDGNDRGGSPSAKKRAKAVKKVDMATDGIRIREWTAKSVVNRKDGSPKEKDLNSNIITFSTWDFAGQELYYYTHLFFLSRRGIYLFIFNLLKPEEEASRIEYWLQSIHTRARGAPVILVGTHLDAKKCTKKYLDHLYANLLQKFSGQFKNIRFFFALSCATGKGVEDLRKKLVEVAQSMIDREGLIPQSYLTLEEKIRAIAALEPQPVVSWEIFERLALSSGVAQNMIPKAAKYLHQLGSLVHFTERESGLDDLVILDSQWLTNVFSDVITLKHNFVKDGILQRKNLPQIWKAPVYPDTVHDSLVALLEQFEVAYALPPSETSPDGAILVPCLLPDTRPPDLHNADMWPEEQTELIQLARFYSFEFMPFGFFNRFMVRLLRSGWLLVRCWKNGMFFIKGEDKLLLELDAEVAFRLKLSIRGTAPSRQMLVLTAMIDTLIADWLRVEVKVTIPCTHCVNENAQPFLFTQAQLELAISKGKTVVNCRGVDVVGIFALAPDLVMMELNRIMFKFEELQLVEQPLAITNKSKVSKAVIEGETLVVKQYSEISLSASSLAATAASNEFRALIWEISGLEHPNIVPLRGLCVDPLCLVMEYSEGPSLASFLSNPAAHRQYPFDWKFRVKVAADVARALMFLHSITPALIHGRLKSSNVLLGTETVHQESVVIARVADFGLYSAPIYAENRQDAPYWIAPEVLAKQTQPNAQSDVYSYGTLLYELLTRDSFFAKQIPESSWSGVEKRVLEGDRPQIPSDCYPEYKDLITDCWQSDASARPSFESILKRISRLAIKYDLPLPGPSGRIALPSYSVRNFSVGYEDEEESEKARSRRKALVVDEEFINDEEEKENDIPASSSTSASSQPAAPSKEENSIKRRLQNTLASLQRELESDEQEAAGASITPQQNGTPSEPEKKPEAVTSSPPPLQRNAQVASPPKTATSASTPVGSKVTKLTLRSSGSGSKDREYINLEGKGSYNSALQRQVDRLKEQVESLQSALKEAQKAQSKAERSLAFQILENDRQHTQIERLKRKVESLKSENDKLVKESSTAPRIVKTQGRAKQTPASKDAEREATGADAEIDTISTPSSPGRQPALGSSVSEGFQKKRQLTAISTSTRAQRTLFTPYASPAPETSAANAEIDVQEIQERLRRRSLSKRILDRLAYWENVQQRQGGPSAPPSPLSSRSSNLVPKASTNHPHRRTINLGDSGEARRRASDGSVDTDKGKEKVDSEPQIRKLEIDSRSIQDSRKRVELLSPRETKTSKSNQEANDKPSTELAEKKQVTPRGSEITDIKLEDGQQQSKDEGGKELADATIAKRKFLQRSSSSNNSMARKRLSMSGKSLRDMSRVSLASGASSIQSGSGVSVLSASGPVALATNELSGVGGINQIFYGKAELVKLLLELDEFD